MPVVLDWAQFSPMVIGLLDSSDVTPVIYDSEELEGFNRPLFKTLIVKNPHGVSKYVHIVREEKDGCRKALVYDIVKTINGTEASGMDEKTFEDHFVSKKEKFIHLGLLRTNDDLYATLGAYLAFYDSLPVAQVNLLESIKMLMTDLKRLEVLENTSEENSDLFKNFASLLMNLPANDSE